MAGRRPSNEVRRAARKGLAAGLQQHLPGAVGLVIKGVPLCGLAAFAHLVLGIGITGTTISAILSFLGLARTS